MGKDHELLEAARTGNLLAVKTILSGKLPRSSVGSGGLTGSIRSLLALKAVNINCTDSNGETPLHLSALNGHKDVVAALLGAKASAMEVDTKGCTPLHLAAWNGHAEICDMLIQYATDKSVVNIQTIEGETPLHFAAQHGHIDVVNILLQNKADPTFRTLTERSALDLAAQFGKKEVVRALVTGRPELMVHMTGQPSPLHLAAFNGHLQIVNILLDSGYSVNTRTDNGTALHEAATSCKLDVIKLLLDRGIDVFAKSKNGMTAEDILKSIHSQLTKDALQIISGHVNNQRTPDSDGEKSINGMPGPGTTEEETSSEGLRPIPKPRSILRTESPEKVQFPIPPSLQSDPGEAQSPPPPIPPRMSLRQMDYVPKDFISATVEAGPGHLGLDVSEANRSRSREASPMSREQPKKPPRKTPSMRRTEATQTAENNTGTTSTSPSASSEAGDAILPDPVPCVFLDQSRTDYVNVNLDHLQTHSLKSASIQEAAESVISSGEQSGMDSLARDTDYVHKENAMDHSSSADQGGDDSKVDKPHTLELSSSKRKESEGEVGNDEPTSPNNYAQPPTPDCPPPSPGTAIQGIHQKINPQDKRKSKDMETITESNLLLTMTAGPSGVIVSSLTEISDMSASDTTDQETVDSVTDLPKIQITQDRHSASEDKEIVEEKVSHGSKDELSSSDKDDISLPGDRGADNSVELLGEVVQMRRSLSSGSDPSDSVFAGLLKGSTPGGSRNVVSQISENVAVKTARTKRRSGVQSAITTFDPLMEKEEDRDSVDTENVFDEIDKISIPSQQRELCKSEESFDDSEEWAKIAATLETFGAGIARESVFVREYEASFAKALTAGPHKIQSVGEWLESFGMGQYENTLVANGYDDTDFLGGNIVEDNDLEKIGICNADHRAIIVATARKLPPVSPIDQNILPETLESWLESIHLGEYVDTFISHKYNTMQRVIKLWELELNTVLDISSIGHRKRILASLGERPKDPSHSPARIRKQGSLDEPKSPFEHIDLYRDYTGVKPRGSDSGEQSSPLQSPHLNFEKNSENGLSSPQGIRDSQIHIRPPHLMHTTGSIKQWRHRPEVLIKGCCNYTAHYLGSTLVRELKGPTSTQEGIAKLKKSTEVINKIPTIMLSISYKGVKFIDAKSKKVICDHEIVNIFCACQDADHMNFFAYVTKDKETNKHYCHVFSVRSRELAGEIILTLGEAFEIAYQMALKERAEEDAFQFERQLSQSDQDDRTSVSSKASINTV